MRRGRKHGRMLQLRIFGASARQVMLAAGTQELMQMFNGSQELPPFESGDAGSSIILVTRDEFGPALTGDEMLAWLGAASLRRH